MSTAATFSQEWVRVKLLPFSLAILALLPAPAMAFTEERGGWTITDVDGGCAMGMEFEGPGSSYLLLSKSTDGELLVMLTNDDWSAKSGERYKVEYVIGEKAFGGGTAIGVRNGFVTKFAPNFEGAFSAGQSLHVYLDDKRVDQLSLSGTGAAIAAVNRCLAGVRQRLAAERREKERWAHLPKDPFASTESPDGPDGCPTSAAGQSTPATSAPAPTVPPPPACTSANTDIAAPLRAAQAAKPATGGEDQFRKLFSGWQQVECRTKHGGE